MTIKILSEVNQQGIMLYIVTKDNLSSVIGKLNVGNRIKNDITTAVNNGRTVIIPAKENVTIIGKVQGISSWIRQPEQPVI